jgi:hypothetical protein
MAASVGAREAGGALAAEPWALGGASSEPCGAGLTDGAGLGVGAELSEGVGALGPVAPASETIATRPMEKPAARSKRVILGRPY